MNVFLNLLGANPGASALLGAMVVASVLGLTVAPSLVERSLFRPHWVFQRGQYTTLITNAFMHADLAHLLFNAFTFWAFAFSLEQTIGTQRFVALYFFGLFASDLGTWLNHRKDPGYQCLGASGAILAVLFASIVYRPSESIFILPIPVPIPAPLFAIAYLAYSFYASRQARGRINHDAHLAGAVAGIAFVAITDFEAMRRAVESTSLRHLL